MRHRRAKQVLAREKGSGTFCRNGPEGASHKRCLTPFRRLRRAFTMLELMIAIIIMGIGMVMVATIFPIGLDISRQTIQQSIAQAVTDAAMATLRVKVPGFQEIGPNIPGTPLVGVPVITDEDAAEDATAPTRLFTEASAWDGDAGGLWQTSFIMPAQNVPVNYAALSSLTVDEVLNTLSLAGLPPRIAGSPGPPWPPRIHLADRVYPPVPVVFNLPPVPSGIYSPSSDPNGMSYRVTTDPEIIAVAASRRYAWAAIHHRRSQIDNGEERSDFVVTVVVLHRADLNARYARQADTLKTGLLFDLSNIGDESDPVRKALTTYPDLDADVASNDTLFPQPWLVVLDAVDRSTGTVTCTATVARLLPEGAYFFVAQSQGSLYAGTFYDIVDVVGIDVTSDTATLKIALGSGAANNVPVWVFPPPIVSRGKPPTFGPRSPVVGPPMIRTVER